MIYDIDSMSEEKVREELDMYVRFFDVAYTALLMIAEPNNPNDKRQLAANAIALISRYPNDDRFVCGGTAKAKLLEEQRAQQALQG